ncbi:hypothetical protein R3P38DRAFT_2784085 [Favolaschia claudopus]|uniref:F-box domain-containing protein n=1 Tax=Favolaschia claudopus TaxID=2862362 RepID=A0AAW0AZS3_9AGAR
MSVTRQPPQTRKSIMQWLPNEVLTLVTHHATTRDLASLCRTARLMCNLAIPTLYRNVALCNAAQLEKFVRTMSLSPESTASLPLSSYVRQLKMRNGQSPEEMIKGLSLQLISAADFVLGRLFNLEKLELLLLISNRRNIAMLQQMGAITSILGNDSFPSVEGRRPSLLLA